MKPASVILTAIVRGCSGSDGTGSTADRLSVRTRLRVSLSDDDGCGCAATLTWIIVEYAVFKTDFCSARRPVPLRVWSRLLRLRDSLMYPVRSLSVR